MQWLYIYKYMFWGGVVTPVILARIGLSQVIARHSSPDYTESSRTSWTTKWDPVLKVPLLLQPPPPQLERDGTGLLKSPTHHPNLPGHLLPFLFPLIPPHPSRGANCSCLTDLDPEQASAISLLWTGNHDCSFHFESLAPWSLSVKPMVVPVLSTGNWSLSSLCGKGQHRSQKLEVVECLYYLVRWRAEARGLGFLIYGCILHKMETPNFCRGNVP